MSISVDKIKGTIKEEAVDSIKNKINYKDILNDELTDFSFQNILNNYFTLFTILVIALGMYLLSFVTDCFNCGIVRTLFIFIYVYAISLYTLITYIKKQCNYSLRSLNEIQIAFKCSIIFLFSYILINLFLYSTPFNYVGPFKVLIPTFFGIIALYFYLVRARQLAFNASCNNTDKFPIL